MRISPIKRIPIAIVGLENAGKPTFVLSLQTGDFKQPLSTSGLDTEIIDIGGNLFQLFDLGGHKRFRYVLWKKYIQLSQGIAFIINSSDIEKQDEVVNWLWKCLEWNLNEPVLILANKTDLNHFPLDNLMEKIKISQLPIINSNRSFQILNVSMKIGTNLDKVLV